MIITFAELESTLHKLFVAYDFTPEKAALLASVYAESTLDGVYSHGINRVPLFIEYIKKGVVNIHTEAECANSFGLMERWDGHLGPGIINATKCMNRAIELAKTNGMGLVALRNTNHWMRGGTYGWQAANAGCIGICFTNTQPNMPPWGGKESRTGNNPLIIAIPRKGAHIVLDMALSQFAFGKINDYKLRKQLLPFPGGWDLNDELSNDPEKITQKERGLPIGYWKGSALSMVLDMLVTILSAGDSTYRIGQRSLESGISQVFICIDPEQFGDMDFQQKLLQEIIDYTHDGPPMKPGDKTYYPGEKTLLTRAKNLKEGIAINDTVWEKVVALMKE
ncbi:MAG: 3-dehydro-L-gulonate 2-dehydrogenase [Cyclobacteriaceae bacterium]|nr:3-dehydro-L-gulonate 2-dehydrogenase [Cyclobacteriaceae bacterium]